MYILLKEVIKVHVKNYMRSIIAWLKHKWILPIPLNGSLVNFDYIFLMIYKCINNYPYPLLKMLKTRLFFLVGEPS